MKNITLAVEDQALKAARIYAVEHGTTVNAMVRDFLSRFLNASRPSASEQRAKIREELAELGERTEGRIGEWKWNRDDIYAERFSRYEHSGLRRVGEGQGPKGD